MISFVDDFSKNVCVYIMKTKDEVFAVHIQEIVDNG